jgi:hypothetical protein
MGAVKVIFIQPRVNDFRQFPNVHRLIMTVKAFPLKRTGEPLRKGLFLGDLGFVQYWVIPREVR